jgi:short-subunit dehydrogenase
MKEFFRGKTIVITGASAGLGNALTLMLAPFDCNIAGIGRNTEALHTLRQKVEQLGSRFLPLTCDVANQHDCQKAIQKVLSEWNHIDILINNAGFTHIALFQPDTHLSIVRNIMETNFFGSVYCTAYAFDSIIRQKGSIICISSVAGFAPLVGRTAYAASKHAMHGFFNTLRNELKEKDVHVMLVCPQFIATNIRTNKPQVVAGKELNAEYVAEKILKATVKKKTFLLIGKTAIFAWWIYKFFPKFYEYMMFKSQYKKINF